MDEEQKVGFLSHFLIFFIFFFPAEFWSNVWNANMDTSNNGSLALLMEEMLHFVGNLMIQFWFLVRILEKEKKKNLYEASVNLTDVCSVLFCWVLNIWPC